MKIILCDLCGSEIPVESNNVMITIRSSDFDYDSFERDYCDNCNADHNAVIKDVQKHFNDMIQTPKKSKGESDE